MRMKQSKKSITFFPSGLQQEDNNNLIDPPLQSRHHCPFGFADHTLRTTAIVPSSSCSSSSVFIFMCHASQEMFLNSVCTHYLSPSQLQMWHIGGICISLPVQHQVTSINLAVHCIVISYTCSLNNSQCKYFSERFVSEKLLCVKSAVPWNVMPCILAEIYQHFRHLCCLHHHMNLP